MRLLGKNFVLYTLFSEGSNEQREEERLTLEEKERTRKETKEKMKKQK